MNELGMIVGAAGALAGLTLEGVKWLWRKYVVKSEFYDFPVKFYVFMLPVLSFMWQPALSWLGLGEYVVPGTWQEWLLQLATVVMSSLIGLATYKVSIKPLKDYSKTV